MSDELTLLAPQVKSKFTKAKNISAHAHPNSINAKRPAWRKKAQLNDSLSLNH